MEYFIWAIVAILMIFFVYEAIMEAVWMYRRKKHPKYFELENELLAATVDLMNFFNTKLKPAADEYLHQSHKAKQAKGELIEQELDVCDKLYERYETANAIYENKSKHCREILAEMDEYEKEHNLKWHKSTKIV